MKQLFKDLRWGAEEILLGMRDALHIISQKEIAFVILSLAVAIALCYY